MVGIVNNAECMITLTGSRFRPSTKDERGNGLGDKVRVGVENLNLTPGFNVADNDKWELCSGSNFAKKFLDAGILVAGMRKSSDDVALDKQMQKEIDAEKRLYEIERPKGASSILPKGKYNYELEAAPQPAPIG